jgi:hypothetical protein
VAIVAVTELKPGVVLERPVYSPRGILLASSGSVVTDAHIATFTAWGVRDVRVAVGGETPAPSTRRDGEALAAEIKQLVEDRFSLVEPLYPFTREVRRVAELLLLKRAERDASEG